MVPGGQSTLTISISPPRLVTTTLVNPLDPPCLTQLAWITLRVLTGFVAETSLVPVVTVDNGEGDHACDVHRHGPHPDGLHRQTGAVGHSP